MHLGIDFGTKRIGLAIASEELAVALPFCTCTPKEFWKNIAHWIQEHRIRHVVIGEALFTDGNPMPIMEEIKKFARTLSKQHPALTFTWIDERYTSKIAAMQMWAGGFREKDRRDKTKLDERSASIILQQYLDQT